MKRVFRFPWRSARDIRTDVDEELRFHLETRTEALIADGVPLEAARTQAAREFGDVDDAHRSITAIDRGTEAATRRRDRLTEFRRDARYALRKLRATPAFTAAALLTLALGIGANTAIFSLVNGVLIRPLPFPRPEQLYQVWSASSGAGGRARGAVSPVDLDDWRAQRRVIADIGGWWFADEGSGTDLTGPAQPRRLSVAFVSPGFFPTLGVAPLAGRLPREDEMVRGGDDHVVVLSYGFWARQFGGARAVVDSAITLDGTPYRVLGVMPRDFVFPSDRLDAWIPYSSIPDNMIPRIRVVRVLDVIARARPGVTEGQVRAEMNTIASRLAQQFPEDAPYASATVMPLAEAITGPVRRALLVLLGAVGVVLLLACVNVASLLLARAAVRGREMAIRAALGAGRGRLVQQMLVESLTLAITGGALGLLVAGSGLRGLLALGSGELPRAADVRIDGTVLVFTVGLSLVSGLIFGVLPALRASSPRLQEALGAGSRGAAGATIAGQRLRDALVITEVALAVVLAVGAGLMTRSFVRLLEVDPGFRADHLLAVNFTIDTDRHPQYAEFYHEVIDKARAVPGVIDAGAVKDAPFRGNGERVPIRPPGAIVAPGEEGPTASLMHVSDGYFRTIGAPIVSGREFEPEDQVAAKACADCQEIMPIVINQALARRDFPDRDPVGLTMNLGGKIALRVIGVVSDIRQVAMDEAAQPTIYLDNMLNARVKVTLVARTRGDPLRMAQRMREALWSLDKDQTITSVFTYDDLVRASVARPRLLTVLLGGFSALGLVLGALGLYGVLAYLVSQRERDIGLRMALGARPVDVLGLIVRRGVGVALIGVGVGTVAALGLTRFLRGVLFNVAPTDVTTFVAVAAALIAVAALASWLPARRASRVDPAIALRSE